MATVNFYAAARAAAGTTRLTLNVNDVGALMAELTKLNTKMAKLLPTCTYLLNGIACEDLNQNISESDEIDVLPQFAGG
jgi:molybdopterin converting factor small subunit